MKDQGGEEDQFIYLWIKCVLLKFDLLPFFCYYQIHIIWKKAQHCHKVLVDGTTTKLNTTYKTESNWVFNKLYWKKVESY